MVKKCLSIALIALLTLAANSAFVLAQTNPNNSTSNGEKIKADVLKRGTGVKKIVTVKMLNGAKIKGYISQTGADSFTLTDSETGQTNTVAYRDAAQIKGGGLSKGAKIAIGVGIAAAATLTVLYIAFQNAIKDN